MSSQAAIALANEKAKTALARTIELESEQEGLPKTVVEYMKPLVKEKESTIVLPRIIARLF